MHPGPVQDAHALFRRVTLLSFTLDFSQQAVQLRNRDILRDVWPRFDGFH